MLEWNGKDVEGDIKKQRFIPNRGPGYKKSRRWRSKGNAEGEYKNKIDKLGNASKM